MTKKTLIIILMITSFAFIHTGCKKKVDVSKRGITDTEIKIGQWGPQSGPAALWGAVARGTDCYFKMINDEGGIAGRKIKYYIRDDGYQPGRTKTEVKRLVEGEGVFAFIGGLGTATGMTVKEYLKENKVPWINPSSPSYHWTNPMNKYLFTMFPLSSTEAKVMIDYSINKLGKKKFAVIYQNDDYGKFGLHSAEVVLEKLNMKLAGKVSVELTDTDLSSHALKLKNSGADAILLWVNPKHAAIIVGLTNKINYKPQYFATSTLSDMMIMHKITKGAWKDVIFSNFVAMPDSNDPLMKKYRAAKEKYSPNERWGVFYYVGFMFAEPMVKALKHCGKDLSADKFIKAMESIKNFRGIGPVVDFGPDKRQGSNSVFLAQCISGSKYKKLTDWISAEVDIKEIIKRMK